jgi:hypothetical protein
MERDREGDKKRLMERGRERESISSIGLICFNVDFGPW